MTKSNFKLEVDLFVDSNVNGDIDEALKNKEIIVNTFNVVIKDNSGNILLEGDKESRLDLIKNFILYMYGER